MGGAASGVLIVATAIGQTASLRRNARTGSVGDAVQINDTAIGLDAGLATAVRQAAALHRIAIIKTRSSACILTAIRIGFDAVSAKAALDNGSA